MSSDESHSRTIKCHTGKHCLVTTASLDITRGQLNDYIIRGSKQGKSNTTHLGSMYNTKLSLRSPKFPTQQNSKLTKNPKVLKSLTTGCRQMLLISSLPNHSQPCITPLSRHIAFQQLPRFSLLIIHLNGTQQRTSIITVSSNGIATFDLQLLY